MKEKLQLNFGKFQKSRKSESCNKNYFEIIVEGLDLEQREIFQENGVGKTLFECDGRSLLNSMSK